MFRNTLLLLSMVFVLITGRNRKGFLGNWQDTFLMTTSYVRSFGTKQFGKKRQVLRLIAIDRLASGLDLALDLPLYLGEPRGQKIRNVVIDEIRNAMKETEGGVVLVGHSLGSVIAYDVARKNLHSETPLKIKALITLGSPLDWVTDIRIAEGAKGDDDYSLSGINWINIYDDADPVSIREELPIDRFGGVKNISIHSGEKYILAHTCYWENEEVAKIIRNEIF